jgi:5'-nucleotidase
MENLYTLATNNYIAGGGSGYLVLQRNTTQQNTYIGQRDAMLDYMQQGKPCGYNSAAPTAEGLEPCSTDNDCSMLANGPFVCACPGHVTSKPSGGVENCVTSGQCDESVGRCVLASCRSQVAQYHEQLCAGSPQMTACLTDLDGCTLGGEECKILSCVDASEGASEDGRITVIQ